METTIQEAIGKRTATYHCLKCNRLVVPHGQDGPPQFKHSTKSPICSRGYRKPESPSTNTKVPERMAKGWTFQRLIDENMKVTACCHHAPCNHHQRLDLAKLRDRFGPDAPAMEWDIRPKLKCSKCGGKAVGLIYSPDTTSSAYREMKGG